MTPQETIVMSVGGSLIVPGEIDTSFLAVFKAFIENETSAHGRRFIVITGGGKTARKYADAAKSVAALDTEDLDWLGIHATRLNGHLLRTVFKSIAYPIMLTNPDDVLDAPKDAPLIVAAGYRPGASTDLRAVQIAERVGAVKVINLSNTDYVYTDNPNTNPDAQKIEDIAWSEFRKLIPEEWDPGLSSPFDPIAAKEAEAKGIEVACINGAHLDELANYLDGKAFRGTRIHI
jgi:uridylate kinase